MPLWANFPAKAAAIRLVVLGFALLQVVSIFLERVHGRLLKFAVFIFHVEYVVIWAFAFEALLEHQGLKVHDGVVVVLRHQRFGAVCLFVLVLVQAPALRVVVFYALHQAQAGTRCLFEVLDYLPRHHAVVAVSSDA